MSSYGISYQPLSMPDVVQVAAWFDPLLHMFTHLVYLDTIWRVLQTLRMIRSHWAGTAVALPRADARKKSSPWVGVSVLSDGLGVAGSSMSLLLSSFGQLWLSLLLLIGLIVAILFSLSGRLQ
jgi:hypothetical protein